LAVLDRMAKAVHAVAGDQLLDLCGLRRHEADTHAIAKLRKLDRLEHFGKQPSGIEGEHVDLGARFGNGVQDSLILEPEAGGEDDATFDLTAHLPDAVDRK